MTDIFSFLFSDAGYTPHGYCLAWDPRLIFLHVFSDVLIALSYFSIPVALFYFARRRPDLGYRKIVLLFAAFIFACGLTHMFAVLTLWQPLYGLEGVVKLLTAIVSLATATILWPLIPHLIAMPSAAQLRAANAALEREVGERRRAQQRLLEANEAAEARLNRRTAEMTELNLQLSQQVSKHQAIERELAETTAQFTDLASRTKTGIIHETESGKVLRASLQYAALIGAESPDELIGRTAEEWIVEPDAEGMRSFRRAVFLGSRESIEMRVRRADGSLVDMEKVAAVSHYRGEPIIVGFVRDITQRKTIEREAEIARLRMARSNEDLERFASIASHDLNAPLRHLRIIIDTVIENADGRLEQDSVKLLRQGYDATERMSALIKDLLDFSRIGSIENCDEPVDLNDILKRSIANLTENIKTNDAMIEVGQLPSVSGNAGALIHLWQNLLNNAMKYRSERPPEISVTAADVGEGWEIAVTDNGMGVPAEQADRIFEMHVRLHAYNDIPGSGIGLSACRRVVELHGGRIWLDTSYTDGARFVVWLPKRPESGGQAAVPQSRSA